MNLRTYIPILMVLQACTAARANGPVVVPVAVSLAAEVENKILPQGEIILARDSDAVLGSATVSAHTEPLPHPLADLSDEELEAKLLSDPESLGPLSLGRPGSGALFGAAPMVTSERWEVVNPKETWATPETVAFLSRCINRVNEQFADTPKLPIGDISTRSGGYLGPHLSHQSGRDVDVGYYYSTPERWYTRVTKKNLDRARSWAFVRAMVTDTDVEVIFMDRSVQALLRQYAQEIGEDAHWLDELFGGPSRTLPTLIRHAKGHKSHIHVRYYNPIAQESGRRLYRTLLKHKKIKPPTYFIKHKVSRGETLIRIARKYRTSASAIKKANGLRTSRIVANRHYRIPRRGGVEQGTAAVIIPARRIPPKGPTPMANSGGSAGAGSTLGSVE